MFRKIADTYLVAFSGLRREVWLLSLVVLINRCGTMAIPFMSIYITQGMGRSIDDAGLVISLFGIGAVLGTQTGGYLTDHLGFRVVQVGTTILASLFFFLFSLTATFWVLCVFTVCIGFFAEAFKPANFTAIATYAKAENISRSYSLNRLAVNIGFGLGASMGGLLAAINYKLLFYVEGGVYLLVAILIVLLLPSRKQAHKELKESRKGVVVLSPWKDRYFIKLMAFVTLYTTCFILLFRLVPVYWKEIWHINEAYLGLLMGLNGLIIAVFEMVLVNYMERQARPFKYLIRGVLITAAAYLVLLIQLPPHLLFAIITVLVFTLGEMFFFPFVNRITSLRANDHNRGKYAAVYSFTWSFAQVIGPAGGALIVAYASYSVLWICIIGISLLAFFGLKSLETE